jgi:hypothetical protein
VQTLEFSPDSLAHRYYSRQLPTVRSTALPATVELRSEPFPTGSARVSGEVHNQFGQPLREFYIMLARMNRRGRFDYEYFSVNSPIVSDGGKYQIDNLPPGQYSVTIRHFDYTTHVWRRNVHPLVTIPDEPNVVIRTDFEVEAKELLYGQAVFDDDTPVRRGSWIARFTKDPTSPFGGEFFSLNLGEDGRFRVCLSAEERQQLLSNFAGMVNVSARDDAGMTIGVVHVPVDQLSSDPAAPTRIVISKKTEAQDR